MHKYIFTILIFKLQILRLTSRTSQEKFLPLVRIYSGIGVSSQCFRAILNSMAGRVFGEFEHNFMGVSLNFLSLMNGKAYLLTGIGLGQIYSAIKSFLNLNQLTLALI